MNEVFLDTETTGLSFKEGHKIVEVACIETKDLIPTGNIFHRLINPKRDVPDEAFKVHGFSKEFLSNKEIFENIAEMGSRLRNSNFVSPIHPKTQLEHVDKNSTLQETMKSLFPSVFGPLVLETISQFHQQSNR